MNDTYRSGHHAALAAFFAPFWAETCRDCHVDYGERHSENCDTATCLVTGQQRKACKGACGTDCGHDTWTGIDHSTRGALRLGLWTKKRFRRRVPDTRFASLRAHGTWEAASRQWVD